MKQEGTTETAISNFYKLDNKEYILEKNQEFMFWYNQKIKEGYQPFLSLKELQKLMYEIVSFFEFKYHQNMITEMHNHKKSKDYLMSLEISEKLGIEELKYRLSPNALHFLECDYDKYFELKKKKKHLWDLPRLIIFVDEFGTISENSLSDLKDYEYLEDIEGITTIPDLLKKLLTSSINIDYSDLKRKIFNNKTNRELRKKFLELTMLAMLYSKNSHPSYSYVRIKSFIRMFNKEYNLNLNTSKIDEIMNFDYQQFFCYTKTKVKQRLKKLNQPK